MKIDEKMVDRLAELAKLQFDDESRPVIMKNLEKILGLVEKMNELDLEGVEPLVYMSEEVNVLREDAIQKELSKEEILLNAPLRDSDFIKVPKVLKN